MIKTTLEHTDSVTSLDFKNWHDQHGIKTLLFDIEGTLTEWASPEVESDIIEKLKSAREDGIKHIGLVTNINPKYHQRVADVAEQVDADIYRFPTSFFHRKPSGAMIKDCLEQLGSSPEQCGFIGDKLFDAMAARNARVKHMAWVSRHGKADQWFDRYVYRLLEPVIKRMFS